MLVDFPFIESILALLLGFLVRVFFDELKSPKLKITGVSQKPYAIGSDIQLMESTVDRDYSAYRLRVENTEKRFLNCAADNCMAWLELDFGVEPYQLCWVGNHDSVTINVGDVREVDFCAVGSKTGRIYSPTEKGYFEKLPRMIGDGTSELRCKLRITSKNGKSAERNFIIKPPGSKFEILMLNEHSNQDDDSQGKPQIDEFKPLPWGTLFFSFWMTLKIVNSPEPFMRAVSLFFLIISGILLLAVFAQPLMPLFRKFILRYAPLELSKIVNGKNIKWLFATLVFFTTLVGFPTDVILNWSNLQTTDVYISVIGLVLWLIAYVLVLVGIVSKTRVGQILGGIISFLILFSAKNAFSSNTTAGWILVGIGVISLLIVLLRPKYWDLSQII
jgi:hypothetical protein